MYVHASRNLNIKLQAASNCLQALCEHRLEKQVDLLPLFIYDLDLTAFFKTIFVLCHASDSGESFGPAVAGVMPARLPVTTDP